MQAGRQSRQAGRQGMQAGRGASAGEDDSHMIVVYRPNQACHRLIVSIAPINMPGVVPLRTAETGTPQDGEQESTMTSVAQHKTPRPPLHSTGSGRPFWPAFRHFRPFN